MVDAMLFFKLFGQFGCAFGGRCRAYLGQVDRHADRLGLVELAPLGVCELEGGDLFAKKGGI